MLKRFRKRLAQAIHGVAYLIDWESLVELQTASDMLKQTAARAQSLKDSLQRAENFDGEPVLDIATGEVFVNGKPFDPFKRRS